MFSENVRALKNYPEYQCDISMIVCKVYSWMVP